MPWQRAVRLPGRRLTGRARDMGPDFHRDDGLKRGSILRALARGGDGCPANTRGRHGASRTMRKIVGFASLTPTCGTVLPRHCSAHPKVPAHLTRQPDAGARIEKLGEGFMRAEPMRHDFLDWLRVLAIAVLLFFHT